MKTAFKIVISLLALVHFLGFIQAAFMPIDFLESFGVIYNDSLLRITTHFGLLLLIFAIFQTLAAVWTFQGKIEGIQLGLIAGLAMLLSFVLDLLLIQDQQIDYFLFAMGAITVVTAYLALPTNDEPQ